MFFTKKIIQTIGLLTWSLSLPVASLAALSALPVKYENYSNQKTESDTDFDFDANDISDKEIIMDGERESSYELVLDFGKKTQSSAYDINLFAYHGEEALYFYFDVYDEHVNQRAIGANNAHDEDGVEISIDPLLNGGIKPQLDDLRIYAGVSGKNRVNKGTGTGWGSQIGFGVETVRKIKPNTTVNDNSDIDTGYCIEMRIPYISFAGEATKNTPFAFAFVHSTLESLSGTRSRTGMSGHPTFKISTADTPDAFIVLTSNNTFYTRTAYNNLNENRPSVVGRIRDNHLNVMSAIRAVGYYKTRPSAKAACYTDNNGYFSFENIDTTDDFIVEANQTGFYPYTVTYDKQNLVNANGAEYFQEFYLVPNNVTSHAVNGKITTFGTEDKSNFKVTVLGRPTTSSSTAADGSFSVDVYDGMDAQIIISKDKYETVMVDVAKDVTSLPTLEMYHNFIELASPKELSLLHNYASFSLVRGNNSVFAKITSPYEIKDEELASLYFNINDESGFSRDYKQGDCRLDYVDGEVVLSVFDKDSYAFKYDSDKTQLIKAHTKMNVLYETIIEIPYAALGMDKDATFGAASSFFNGDNEQVDYVSTKIVKDGEIDYTSTATYPRFDKDGNVFFAKDNIHTDFLYYYHGVDGAPEEDIPNNADRMYMTYSRDKKALTLTVDISAGFGRHFNTNYNIAGMEAANILLNLDEFKLTGWALYSSSGAQVGYSYYDINLRIYADDTICYINSNDVKYQGSNQMWWSDAAHNNGVAKNFTLNSKLLDKSCYEVIETNGSKKYVITLSYDTLHQMSGAPDDVEFDRYSDISFEMFEISETSKTTVRFYTSSGDAWLFQNKELKQTIGVFSSQANYISLPYNA